MSNIIKKLKIEDSEVSVIKTRNNFCTSFTTNDYPSPNSYFQQFFSREELLKFKELIDEVLNIDE